MVKKVSANIVREFVTLGVDSNDKQGREDKRRNTTHKLLITNARYQWKGDRTNCNINLKKINLLLLISTTY